VNSSRNSKQADGNGDSISLSLLDDGGNDGDDGDDDWDSDDESGWAKQNLEVSTADEDNAADDAESQRPPPPRRLPLQLVQACHNTWHVARRKDTATPRHERCKQERVSERVRT
jgi:hypothetical protein